MTSCPTLSAAQQPPSVSPSDMAVANGAKSLRFSIPAGNGGVDDDDHKNFSAIMKEGPMLASTDRLSDLDNSSARDRPLMVSSQTFFRESYLFVDPFLTSTCIFYIVGDRP